MLKSEIEKLLKDATPGPWNIVTEHGTDLGYVEIEGHNRKEPAISESVATSYINEKANSALIASAPSLARLCLELMEEKEQLEKAVHDAIDSGEIKVIIPPGMVISRGDGTNES